MSIETSNLNPPVEITPELIAEHGLSDDEYQTILEMLGREPSGTELGIFSAMWSEHCSYKSSKVWLKTLPTEGPQVICGPGENAGVVDIGGGQACVFKMESHNHPSFIEPYQGAATGVGGILRDVFTMGARPIANMNALRFGAPDHPKTRHLVSGVVAGIGGYGNCIGVPTVGGETNFHPAYNGNILVNAMTVGIAEADKIFYSAAAGIGNPVVYVGSKTGRDGIHGATMASAEFDEDSEEKRPTVQVGDPFTEKLLLEACLELMATDAIIAIQDMGAAGLTSSSVEMASKGGVGIEIDLDQVPTREEAMNAYEIMLSESQERMLMILKPGHEDEARAVFEKWDLDFAIIGTLTDTGHLVLKQEGITVCDLPLDPIGEKAPIYQRPHEETPLQSRLRPDEVEAPVTVMEALKTLMASPDLCSRRWIWEQYDHQVMADSVSGPGGDAAVVRVHGTEKALAITTDVTPRYCFADPKEGGKQAVAEAWRNLTAVGATPLAITNCLNFGNPTKPRIMGQFALCVTGMGEACAALDFPVVSGNVSLYNETQGTAILPTPAIGGVGLLEDATKRVGIAPTDAGQVILMIGKCGGHLGQSLYLREVCGREEGAPPAVDLEAERQTGDFVRTLIHDGIAKAVHDISDGGLLVAAAEMALAADMGLALTPPSTCEYGYAYLFGEDQARYLVAIEEEDADQVITTALKDKVPVTRIGRVNGRELSVEGHGEISLDSLRGLHEAWLPTYMSGETAEEDAA